MQRCQYCGAEYPDYARFCGKCGQPASGKATRRGTRLILIAIVALLLVALGSGALAFALRSQAPAPAGTPLAKGKITPAGTHRIATATVTASPAATSGPATDTFNFTGAIAGPLVISSFLQCGASSGSYSMQVKGTIDGSSYTFLIGLLSYHGPASYSSNLTINLVKVGTVVSLNNDGRLPVTITITGNGKAGTVSSDLAGLVKVAQPQLSTGHVSGSWTCA